MSVVRLPGWGSLPRLGIVMPPEDASGWLDAAWWAVLLEAWGCPAKRLDGPGQADVDGLTTLVAPAAAIDEAGAEALARRRDDGTSLLLVGLLSPAAAGFLEVAPDAIEVPGRLMITDQDLRARAQCCVPAPDDDGAVALDPPGLIGSLGPDWRVLARWGGDMPAIAVRADNGGTRRAVTAWFGIPAGAVDRRSTEAVILLAEALLDLAAPAGLVGLGRWPGGRVAALVVDGDVDHPTGVDPECARYVAPALETARRAGYPAYGIFVAGANVDAEPASFPPAPGYYNHSYGHPYSHWDPRPWESLTADEMADELRRCDAAFGRQLGCGDERVFRLPHFQLEAAGRTYEVLDALGYRAESSVGANVALTGGLPYHPARAAWSAREADAAWARSHPDTTGRFALLQLPLSSDPSDASFTNGFCSYNTLAEGIRRRTATPEAYEALLGEVVERALVRRSLAHVFIDPPDAGYGRLAGDVRNYAGAVERWLRRCMERDNLAILTTAELASWWSAREAATARLTSRIDAGELVVELDRTPPGTTLEVLEPVRGEGPRRRSGYMLEGPAIRAPGGDGA
jgi:hypothetical protein